MKVLRWLGFITAFMMLTSAAAFADRAQAEWTVMVFMNAKNNLELEAIRNFQEMATVGSTPAVNIVVELGRPKVHTTQEAGGWSGVLRFLVKMKQEPLRSAAVADVSKDPHLSDLGSPDALQDFIGWSLKHYPAKRYMLVIWNHGQGWRFQAAKDAQARLAATSRVLSNDRATFERLATVAQQTPQLGGFRAVSFDDDTGKFLYNSDVAASLGKMSSLISRKIDLVGFDACLMSMLETAYSFRQSAGLMVSSEELEPGPGWDYAAILRSLKAKPTMTARELGDAVVTAYEARYGDRHLTTLSVVDLAQSAAVASEVSRLADSLRASLEKERANIRAARAKVTTYGVGDGLRTSIDLPSFLTAYSEATSDPKLKSLADAALGASEKMVLTNYASQPSVKLTGSKGIAIYFPEDKADFDRDPYKQGYLKDNTDHPVEFVRNETWSNFVNRYLQ